MEMKKPLVGLMGHADQEQSTIPASTQKSQTQMKTKQHKAQISLQVPHNP